MRIVTVLFCLLFSSVVCAGQGYIEKDGVRMPIKSTLAVLDREKAKLSVYLLPSKLSRSEKADIKKGKTVFFIMMEKQSPNKKKWQWYPYAKLEFTGKKGKLVSRDDLNYYYIMAYGLNKKNHTDNINAHLSSSGKLDNFSLSRDRVRFNFSGKSDYSKIKWDLNINSRIE